MGIILLLLSFVGVVSHDLPLLRINNLTSTDVIAIGKPQQKYKWKDPPNIRICATSEVPLSRVDHAVRYWSRLGYDFGLVRKDYLSTCMNPRWGEIIITLPEAGFASSHMAATRLYTSNATGDIVKAKIFILPKNARKDRVLEHELGHALGWSHYRQRYHMMHPNWHFGGYDSYGLRQKN